MASRTPSLHVRGLPRLSGLGVTSSHHSSLACLSRMFWHCWGLFPPLEREALAAMSESSGNAVSYSWHKTAGRQPQGSWIRNRMSSCAENSGRAARHSSSGSMREFPGKKSQGGKSCHSSTLSSVPAGHLRLSALVTSLALALEGQGVPTEERDVTVARGLERAGRGVVTSLKLKTWRMGVRVTPQEQDDAGIPQCLVCVCVHYLRLPCSSYLHPHLLMGG